jgi:hypothetical protein
MAPIVNLINAVPDDDTWKNKWIYLGAKFGPSLHFSFNEDVDNQDQGIPVAAGVLAAVQVLDFLSVQLELNFDMDNGVYRGLKSPIDPARTEDHLYKAYYLYMPLLVKGALKPGRTFLVEPYGGVYLNIPLALKGVELPWGGWLAGLDFGFKVGSGVLFIDLRYVGDLSDTMITGDYGSLAKFERHTVTFSGGYKIGFLNRKQSATRFRGARY